MKFKLDENLPVMGIETEEIERRLWIVQKDSIRIR